MSEELLAAIQLASFFAGYLVHWLITRKERRKLREDLSKANDERYHYVYLWNVVSARLAGIKHMAGKALIPASSDGPYRSSKEDPLEIMKAILEKTDDSLKEVCREVGCFPSPAAAESFIESDGLNSIHDPVIVRTSDWDGPCWHVIYSTGEKKSFVQKAMEHSLRIFHTHTAMRPSPEEKCEKCIHREGWRENECGIGNPSWPDPFCTAFNDQSKGIEPTKIPPPGTKRS